MARRCSLAAIVPLLLLVLSGGGCGPSAVSSMAEQGLREARAGNYAQALATCDEAIRQDASDAKAFVSRGTTYYLWNRDGDFERAIADFNEAIRLAPNSADAHYCRAVAYRDHGDLEKAEADELAARELDVELRETYAQLPKTAPPAGAGPTGQTSLDSLEAGELPKSARSEADDYEEYTRLREKFKSKTDAAPFGAAAADDTFGQQPARTRGGDSKAGSLNELMPPLGGGLDPAPGAAGNRPAPSGPTPFGAMPAQPATRGIFEDADGAQPTPRLPSDLAQPKPAAKSRSLAPPMRPPQLPFGQYTPETGAGPAAPQYPSRQAYPTPFPQRQPRPTGIVRDSFDDGRAPVTTPFNAHDPRVQPPRIGD